MKTKLSNLFSIFLFASLTLPSIASASTPASGSYTAIRACQAYQSIRKHNNPGHTVLKIGQSYPITQADNLHSPKWYRITVDGAYPSERWVYFKCGTTHVSTSHSSTSSHSSGTHSGTACNVAGKEDGFVFAVSWQATFCKGHSSKPECQVTSPNSYQAKNFTLHGLWPNKSSCGTHYGFCGKYKQAVHPFCNFDKVPMSAQTLKQLGVVMPSAAAGSCLQRHEWYKHGTCQTEWDASGYFNEAIHLLADFNGRDNNGVSAFMTQHLGERLPMKELTSKIDQELGKDAHKRMQFQCKNGDELADIYINLPAKLGGASLAALIKQAPEKYNNKCGSSIIIDRLGNL